MTRLVILGLLLERQLYGYEIKHMIEKYMGDWTNIAFGSIYFALNKLMKEGLLEKVATVQEGGRPSRHIYAITEAGKTEFHRLLRSVWEKPSQQYYDMDVAVFFDTALATGEKIEYLDSRITRMEQTLTHLNRHQQEIMDDPHVPKRAALIFSHGRVHLEAELNWLKEVRAFYQTG